MAWKRWETYGETIISGVAESPALQSRKMFKSKPLDCWPSLRHPPTRFGTLSRCFVPTSCVLYSALLRPPRLQPCLSLRRVSFGYVCFGLWTPALPRPHPSNTNTAATWRSWTSARSACTGRRSESSCRTVREEDDITKEGARGWQTGRPACDAGRGVENDGHASARQAVHTMTIAHACGRGLDSNPRRQREAACGNGEGRRVSCTWGCRRMECDTFCRWELLHVHRFFSKHHACGRKSADYHSVRVLQLHAWWISGCHLCSSLAFAEALAAVRGSRWAQRSCPRQPSKHRMGLVGSGVAADLW